MISRGTWIGVIILILFALAAPVAVFLFYPAIPAEEAGKVREIGNLGDIFSIAATIFSAPAFVLLVVTLVDLRSRSNDQQQQIGMQQKQMDMQQERIDMQQKQIDVQQQQITVQQQQVNALVHIAEAISDPVIVVREEVRDSQHYVLTVENVGRTSAYNVRIGVEPKGAMYMHMGVAVHVDDISFLRHPFSSFAPGFKVGALLTSGDWMLEERKLEEREGKERYPKELRFTVTYQTGPEDDPTKREIVLHYTIHWRNRENAYDMRTPEAHELHRIHRNLTATDGEPLLRKAVEKLDTIAGEIHKLGPDYGGR